jgi:hypothetical protein
MAVSLLAVIGVAVAAILLGGLLYLAPFSTFAVLGLLKAGLVYLWRFAAPIWILMKQKGPYKVAALLVTFTGFFTHLYTLGQTQQMKNLDLALTALANTLTGSLQQFVAAGNTLLSGPELFQAVAAVYFIILSVATWYLYWIGWGMLKKRVPELTYYLLVLFSLALLVWGGDGADAVLDAFDLVKDAADQAVGNESVNTTNTTTANTSTG